MPRVAGHRETAEEELRAKAAARAAKWAEEDAQRTVKEAESRRQFDADMARERHEQARCLRALLVSEREKAEAAWRRSYSDARCFSTRGRPTSTCVARHSPARLKAQRASELDLQAEKELHDEDRAGLDRKVERLVTEQNREAAPRGRIP
jgi:hypothetical protein